jgi:hypothetical protein
VQSAGRFGTVGIAGIASQSVAVFSAVAEFWARIATCFGSSRWS